MNRILVIDVSDGDFGAALAQINHVLGDIGNLKCSAFDLPTGICWYNDCLAVTQLGVDGKFKTLDYLASLTKFCKEFSAKLESQIEQESKALKYYPAPQMVAKNE
jgi:hypothetical protein